MHTSPPPTATRHGTERTTLSPLNPTAGAAQMSRGKITQFVSPNSLDVVPAAARDTHAVFVHWFPESFRSAESAIMLDAFSLPDRKLAMEMAMAQSACDRRVGSDDLP